jgi:excisionase family DNA binding protein
MSRQEVAAYLGVPPATLSRWAYEGKGPTYFTVGRHSRYRFEDVLAWLEKNRSQPRPA